MPFDLRPHQEAAIAKMHNGCILCGGVGVGKSHTAVGYYLQNEAPKDVYVITTAKKRDKQDWQFLWGDVGMTGNPENTMGALVTVDSWENIKKYEEVEGAFFIFDEQRLVGSGRWVKAFYKIAAANRWIMLSATPGDNWLDYVPVFRANGFIKNLTQFKEDHVVSRWTGRYYQVTGYRQVPKLVRWRNQLLVDMPYEKHTTRNTHEVAVEYDKDLVRELVKKRWHVYENRPLTDASELFRVMRKVVYSDASRLSAVRNLLESHPKLIVFYNFDYELEILRTLSNERSSENSTSTQQIQGQCGPSAQPTGSMSMEQSTKCHPKNSTSSSSPSPKSSPKELSEQETLWTSDTSSIDSDTSMEPWEYLLSPEGMRANELTPETASSMFKTSTRTDSLLAKSSSNSSVPSMTNSGSGSKSSVADTPSSPSRIVTDSLPDNGSTMSSTKDTSQLSESSPSRNGEEESRRGSSRSILTTRMKTSDLEKKWKNTVTGGSTCISPTSSADPTARSAESIDLSKKWERVTGIPTDHPNAPWGPTSTAVDTNSSTTDRSSSRTSDSTKQQTVSSSESPDTQDFTFEERTEEWTNSQPEHSTISKTSSEMPDTETTSERSGKSSDSQRKSISPTSSTKLRSEQDLSGTTSDSTSSPQFQVAEWNGHKHEGVPTTTSWVYLVQYVAGAEAWECTDTDAICFYSMPYSYKVWWQAHGRIDRLNTPFTDLHYYVLFGNSMIEKAVKASLRAKKSFNESAFRSKMGLF